MKNILILLILFCFLTATSCNKESTTPIDTATINISFKATFGDETLVLNQNTYDYDGKPVRFSKVNFYLSNLSVLNEDGAAEITEIQFIDLTETHTSPALAEKGTVITFSKIPVGTYNGLSFGVGVAADLNRTTPSDYSTSHPLGADNSGEYWEAWDSYIFAKIEGQYDIDGDGFDGDDIAFAYHTGGNASPLLYPEIEIDSPKILKAGETTSLNFELDIKRLLTRPQGSLIVLEQHDPNNQIQEMIIIMDNFKKALQLK